MYFLRNWKNKLRKIGFLLIISVILTPVFILLFPFDKGAFLTSIFLIFIAVKAIIWAIHRFKKNSSKRLTVIFLVVILVAVIFLFPKPASVEGTAEGFKATNCKCFGFLRNGIFIGGSIGVCYGIPYNCNSWVIEY